MAARLVRGSLQETAITAHRAQGGYVLGVAMAADNPALVADGGFALVQAPSPTQPMGKVSGNMLTPGENDGTGRGKWDREPGAKSYEVETAANPAGPWTHSQTVTGTHAEFTGQTHFLGPGKLLTRLLAADRDYYATLYAQLLLREERSGVVVHGDGADRWHQDVSSLPARRARTNALLARSRRRMFARWFKYMVTLDGWVDLMLEKVERTKGIRIEMSPLERKYAYIFGWKYFYRFLRRGLVK